MKNTVLIFLICMLATTKSAWAVWHTIPVHTRKDLLCISFGSRHTAYIGGADSTLLKTTDGGITWNILTPKGIDFSVGYDDLIDIQFVNSNTGYLIVADRDTPVYTGMVYKTTDGGMNWSLSSTVPVASRKIFFFDEDNGLQAGSAFFAGKSVSRMTGGTWQSPVHLNVSADTFLHAMDFYDRNIGMVGGDRGWIYRTFNGGLTWDSVWTGNYGNILDIQYISENIILSTNSGYMTSVEISRDKGVSWNPYTHGSTFVNLLEMRSLVRSGRDSVIMVGKVYRKDSGAVFSYERGFSTPVYFSEHALNKVSMAHHDDSVAFIVGDSGQILTNYLIAVSGLEALKTGPHMLHVYPNPVQEIVQVQGVPEGSILELYDPGGKLVSQKKADAVLVQMNLLQLPKGIYILKLTTPEGYEESTKLMKE